ncbi:MAG TPA: tetratricopeptide repeat protein [Terriglobales bacterium]|nr:tetratricopeptide repeat protein [Terriglobales bacterium]
MTKSRTLLLALAGVLLFSRAPVSAQTDDATKVLTRAAPGTAALTVYGEDKTGGPQGTAMALAADLLATSYHVISQAHDVEVLTAKQKKIKVEGIVGIDRAHDVALLRLKGKLQALNISVSGPQALAPGTRLFTVGSNELGLIVVSEGTLRRFVDIGGGENVMELSLVTSQQASGAPILDVGGQVVGMLLVLERGLKVGLPIDIVQKIGQSGKVADFKSLAREDYFSLFEGASFAGRVAVATDDLMSARTFLERAVKLNPSFADGWALLAGVCDKQRDFSTAVEAYRKATTLDPNRADMFYGLGGVLMRMTKYGEAAEAYEKAVSLNFDKKEVYTELGEAYEAVESWAKAAAAYEKYLSLNPEIKWNGYLRLGVCRMNLQQYDAAIAALLEARKAQPRDLKVNKTLAEAYEKAGQPEKAEEVYNSLAALDPANARIYYRQEMTMYDAAGKPDKAVGPAKKIVDLDPKNDTNIFYLGLMYFKQQKYDEAIDAFKQCLAIKPDLSNAWFQLGSAYFQQKKYTEAAEAYKKYAALAPDDPNGWLSLGVSEMYLKNYEGALEPLKKCVDLRPDNAAAQFNLAIVYINLKDYLSAREVYRKLTTLDPALAEKLKKYLR